MKSGDIKSVALLDSLWYRGESGAFALGKVGTASGPPPAVSQQGGRYLHPETPPANQRRSIRHGSSELAQAQQRGLARGTTTSCPETFDFLLAVCPQTHLKHAGKAWKPVNSPKPASCSECRPPTLMPRPSATQLAKLPASFLVLPPLPRHASSSSTSISSQKATHPIPTFPSSFLSHVLRFQDSRLP